MVDLQHMPRNDSWNLGMNPKINVLPWIDSWNLGVEIKKSRFKYRRSQLSVTLLHISTLLWVLQPFFQLCFLVLIIDFHGYNGRLTMQLDSGRHVASSC